jgi:nucleotide-binding universal stress UspA family protein
MYKKMLVVLDGSKLAEAVFACAQELSGSLNLCLELLHVCAPQDISQLPMRKAYLEHMAEVLQQKSDVIRNQTGTVCPSPVKGQVVVGYPAEEILKYVDENNIDLLMLSTHGSSGTRLWNVGSVANQVIHASKIPVWIVPSEFVESNAFGTMAESKMVIPLDGSKFAEGVLPYALSIAKQKNTKTEIIFVFVENPPRLTRNATEVKRDETHRENTKKYLDSMVKRVKDAGVTAISEVLVGDPNVEIINYLKANPPQLIVMATQAHPTFNKLVFGSVTENVLQLIKKTPLLLVKPQA